MNSYAESRNTILKIRSRDEVLFKMAISHLMDVGIRHLTEENIAITCAEIMKKDDSHAFMTDIVKVAGELAKIDHIHLLTYIAREVEYDIGDSAMSYKRLMEITKTLMDWVEHDSVTSADCYDTFHYLKIDDHEIEDMGFAYMIPDFSTEDGVFMSILESVALDNYIHGKPVYVSTGMRTYWKLPAAHEYSSHAPATDLFYRSLPKWEGTIYYYMKEEF